MDVAVVVVGVGCVIGEETEVETAMARVDDAASEERMTANHVKLFVGGIPLGNSRVAFIGVPKNMLSGAPCGFTYVQFTRDVVVAVALAIALVAGFLLHPSAEAGGPMSAVLASEAEYKYGLGVKRKPLKLQLPQHAERVHLTYT
ncbi:hypothetical protein GUJ93_ZPchr0006g42379 [Zizania palustris]|uniref:Uncharacterized protein n=1 Tax=Zizania palustris TaxID=103762 RepID=A0A8J5T939_ZIZPA|nr:hypothetical protein GUJ93_ZPchr0006g42379 [Zizania palustris]